MSLSRNPFDDDLLKSILEAGMVAWSVILVGKRSGYIMC